MSDDTLIHFKTAVEHSSDAIGMSMPDGRHWYQNKAFDKLFGEIGQDPPTSLYADEQVGRKVFKTIMAGGHWIGEVEMYGKDSNIHNILLRAYAIKDENHRIIGLVGTHTDITDRKRSEEALRESEESMKAILLANPNPMVMYNVNGKPRYMNPAFTDVFGWTLKELKGRRIPFVPDDQKKITFNEIDKIYRERSTSNFESKRFTKDGDIIDVFISAAIAKGPDGKPIGMIVNLMDISERKALQAQYEHAQKMESIGTLAGGIAHDFNNLLMGIQGRASLMGIHLEPGHPHYEHVKGIEEYVKSASDLTRQLLGFARGGKYEVRPVDLNDLVASCSKMFGRTKKELVIHTRLQSSLPVVEADRSQIEQVLINIFVNAWQAMPEGGSLYIETKNVSLKPAFCKPHQIEPGDYVRVSITDTGIGMDKAIRNRIFDPFFTTKEKSRGTGLGLASAFGIIKNHKGLITVDSEIGSGTTFNIHIPASAEKITRKTDRIKKLTKGSETVLLVDDEDLIIDVGQAILKEMGYSVVTAKSGREAIQVIEQMKGKIDLVILDMIMPEMDGGKTFDHLRAIEPHIKVLLSSGYAINGQAEKILRKGCKGFIQKPFTIQKLSGKMRSILDSQ